MPRVTTVIVSDYQRDRVQRSSFYRGERTQFTVEFRAVIPEGDYVSYVEWRCLRPDVTYLSGQTATTTSGVVTLSVNNIGCGVVQVGATLASGKKIVQEILIDCLQGPWFTGENGVIPQGPTYLRADAAVPPGATLTLTGNAPNGTAGQAYSFQYQSTGGTPPYTASVVGLLPNGLTFNSATLTISGTPTSLQTSNFQIIRSSADGQSVTLPDSISIAQGSPQTVILADNPLLYWPLNESSGTVASDLSGNGYNGQYQGAFTLTGSGVRFNTIQAGVFLNCGSLGGSPLDVGSLPEWAMEVVVTYGGSHGSSSGVLAAQWRSTNLGRANVIMDILDESPGNSRVNGRMTDAITVKVTDPNNIPLTRTSFMVSKVAGVLTLYKNGVLVASVPSLSTNNRSDGAGFAVGGVTQSGYFPTSYGFVGTIQHVSVYGHGLSAERALIHAQSFGTA